MHLLEEGELSFDANSVVDFSMTGRLSLLDGLLGARALLSDFVVSQLEDSRITWPQAQVVGLREEAELELFHTIRRNNPSLGIGEVGALTVAHLRRAGLISNDRQTRRAATELAIPVAGSLAVLRQAVETAEMTPEEAAATIEEMITAGAWLSHELVEAFRRDVLKVE